MDGVELAGVGNVIGSMLWVVIALGVGLGIGAWCVWTEARRRAWQRLSDYAENEGRHRKALADVLEQTREENHELRRRLKESGLGGPGGRGGQDGRTDVHGRAAETRCEGTTRELLERSRAPGPRG